MERAPEPQDQNETASFPQCGYELDLAPPPSTRSREMVAQATADPTEVVSSFLLQYPDPTVEDFERLQMESGLEQDKVATILGKLVIQGKVRYRGTGFQVLTSA